MHTPLNRRHFLRSASAWIALPALESLGFRAFSAPKVSPPPKRMIAISFGYGITNETWFPDPKVTGKEYRLSPGLEPLKRHQSRITVVQGLTNKFSNEGHWGSTFYLTGANRYAVPGTNFFNSISADQVVAEAFGKETRFTSLQLNSADNKDSGHGPGLSLAWNRQGKPVAGMESPLAVFQKLFGSDDAPLAERQRMLLEQRSVLDAVNAQAKGIAKRLSRDDRDKLGEYLQSIREIETRLAKDESWMGRPKPKTELRQPPEVPASGIEEVRLMHDLMIAGLRTDSTRVITYRQPHWNLMKALDIDYHPHDVSHYAPGSRMEASQKRDRKMSELLAELIDKLAAVKEADGSSLLDQVALSFGSNIRSVHSLDNCPTILAGGGAGLSHGRHVVASKDTPLCNLWLTLIRGLGVEAERHGDSTGVVKELLG
jgi:hypothetical protein